MMNLFTVTVFIIAIIRKNSSANILDGSTKSFTKNLNYFIEHSIHHNNLQIHMNSLNFNQKVSDGKTILDAMVAKFAEKHRETLEAVGKLQTAVQISYQSHWLTHVTNLIGKFVGGRPSCGRASKGFNFTQSVLSGRACELQSSSAPFGAAKVSKGFEKASMENAVKQPSLKWQYFSSTEGISTVFPSRRITDTSAYDYNKRPWFLQAMKNLPKQVVILIDNTLPKGWFWQWHAKSLKSIKHTAKSYISQLNPQDQIALLYAFGRNTSEKETCINCFRQSFVSATSKNKHQLNDYINDIPSTNADDLEKGINQAFIFFQQDDNAEFRRYCEIVMISRSSSDRHLSVHKMKKLININNHKLQIKVDFKFQNIQAEDSKPQSLFGQNEFSTMATSGATSTSSINLAEKATNIHKADVISKSPMDLNPSWSLPYADKWGLGPVVTVSLSVFQNKHFIGMVAIDTPIKEFFDEPKLLKPNQYTYAFIVDYNGHVINHPLLHHQHDVDMTYVSIISLERDPDFRAAFRSIKRGENGKQKFFATRYRSRGDSHAYEPSKTKILTTFYWERAPNTKYTICLAFVEETSIDLNHHFALPGSAFLHHRFDLSTPQAPCKHYNNYATMENPSVFLPSRCFKDSYKNKLNESDLMKLINYLTSFGKHRNFLKDGIKEEIIVAHQAQVLWLQENNPFRNNIMWRHFTTTSGVFRVYPGIQISEEYDPTTREWYHQSLSYTDRVVITTPYLDPASGSVVVTIAKSIYKHSRYTQNNVINPVVGVAGMDVKLDSFSKQFLSWYPACTDSKQRCYLLDDGGHIIMTDATTEENPRVYFLQKHPTIKLHVAQFEPEITRHLIDKKLIRTKLCTSQGLGCMLPTYRINDMTHSFESSFLVKNEFLSFYMAPVEDTNTFVLIRTLSKRNTNKINHPCFCTIEDCTDHEIRVCDAMLATWNELHGCRHGNWTSYVPAPCIPMFNSELKTFVRKISTAGLAQCYNTTFVHVDPPPNFRSSFYIATAATSLLVFFFVIICIIRRKHLTTKVRKRMSKHELKSKSEQRNLDIHNKTYFSINTEFAEKDFVKFNDMNKSNCSLKKSDTIPSGINLKATRKKVAGKPAKKCNCDKKALQFSKVVTVSIPPTPKAVTDASVQVDKEWAINNDKNICDLASSKLKGPQAVSPTVGTVMSKPPAPSNQQVKTERARASAWSSLPLILMQIDVQQTVDELCDKVDKRIKATTATSKSNVVNKKIKMTSSNKARPSSPDKVKTQKNKSNTSQDKVTTFETAPKKNKSTTKKKKTTLATEPKTSVAKLSRSRVTTQQTDKKRNLTEKSKKVFKDGLPVRVSVSAPAVVGNVIKFEDDCHKHRVNKTHIPMADYGGHYTTKIKKKQLNDSPRKEDGDFGDTLLSKYDKSKSAVPSRYDVKQHSEEKSKEEVKKKSAKKRASKKTTPEKSIKKNSLPDAKSKTEKKRKLKTGNSSAPVKKERSARETFAKAMKKKFAATTTGNGLYSCDMDEFKIHTKKIHESKKVRLKLISEEIQSQPQNVVEITRQKNIVESTMSKIDKKKTREKKLQNYREIPRDQNVGNNKKVENNTLCGKEENKDNQFGSIDITNNQNKFETKTDNVDDKEEKANEKKPTTSNNQTSSDGKQEGICGKGDVREINSGPTDVGEPHKSSKEDYEDSLYEASIQKTLDEANVNYWRMQKMRQYANSAPRSWRKLPHSAELVDFDESVESIPEEEKYLITSFLTEEEQYDYMLFSMETAGEPKVNSLADVAKTEYHLLDTIEEEEENFDCALSQNCSGQNSAT